MKTVLRKLTDIQPYPGNPRDNDGAVEAVARSIREFGWRVPLVIDADGVIICGHTRYKAAKLLGLTEVPVHIATDLAPEQVRAYRLADNRVGEIATWNYDFLPIELTDLKSCDYDLSLLGFDQEELAKLLGGDLREGLTDLDDISEPPDDPVTQPGDLWILGDHRLLCGDAGSVTDLDRLLDGQSVHLVQTDPPYNVRLMYSVAA